MTRPRPDLTALQTAIEKRSRKRNLSLNLDKLSYANKFCLEHNPENNPSRDVLVIGVGSGHEVVFNLLQHNFDSALGVDPYIAADGNDDEDYETLLELIETYDLGQRFNLEKTTIQEYLKTNQMTFDIIFAMDVLHHIFETTEVLRRSPEFDDAVKMFEMLKSILNPEGVLVVSEVQRKGLRPWLKNRNLIKGSVNYRTKQNWHEWKHVMEGGGFTFQNLNIYVPHRLRKFKFLLNSRFGLLTACDRYCLTLSKS